MIDLNKIDQFIKIRSAPETAAQYVNVSQELASSAEEMCSLIRKQEQALADSNASLMEQTELADRCRKQAEAMERAAVPVQAGMPAVTVDSEHFRQLLYFQSRASSDENIDRTAAALVAHIDAHTAQAVAAIRAALEYEQRQNAELETALAAAPQQHAQCSEFWAGESDCPNCGKSHVYQAQQHAQAALSDAQRQNAELVHERLKDIRHLFPGTHASALAKEALPCIRAILAASQQPAAAQHPDDIAWDKFAAAGKAEMAKKRNEGRGGWDNPEQCLVQDLATLLVEQVEMGKPIHIGNFSMMIWNRMQSGYTLGEFDIITAAINHRHAAAPAIQQEGAALDERTAFDLEIAESRITFRADCPPEQAAWRGWQARAALALNKQEPTA